MGTEPGTAPGTPGAGVPAGRGDTAPHTGAARPAPAGGEARRVGGGGGAAAAPGESGGVVRTPPVSRKTSGPAGKANATGTGP